MSRTVSPYAQASQAAYYTQARQDVLRMVPASARSVLDVGCGAGVLGAAIKQRQPARVVGIELAAEPAALAGQRLDAVHCGDATALELAYAPGSFDCLIYADILEHTADPWALLARHRPLLAPGGSLVASLPNVQFAGVIAGLLRGQWTYRDRGVLDRTHLRFFTRSSALAMLAQTGYRVEDTTRAMRWWDAPGSRLHRFARLLAPLPWLNDLFTYQFLFRARPV